LTYEYCGGFCTSPPLDDSELEDDGGSLDLLDFELCELEEDFDELEDDDFDDADDPEDLAEPEDDAPEPDVTAVLECDPIPLVEDFEGPEDDEAPDAEDFDEPTVEDDTEDCECGGVGIVGVMFALDQKKPSHDKMLS
jgi:hypothetical protein